MKLEEISEFIIENKLVEENNILVQAFTGITDKSYINHIQNQIATYLPQAVLLGATTDGEIIDGEIMQGTMILSFTVFNDTKLKTTLLSLAPFDTSYDLGAQLVRNINEIDSKAIILFLSGFEIDGDEMVQGMESIKHRAVLSGGIAGDNGDFKQTLVFDNNTIVEDGVVAVSLSNKNLQVNTIINYDWKKIGTPFSITKANGNRIYELDDRQRPISIMKRYLGTFFTEQLPRSGAEFPFIIEGREKDVYLFVTKVFEVGSVQLSGKVAEGERITFSYVNVPMIMEKSISEIKKLVKKPVETIFAFNCMARRVIIGTLQ